MNSKERIMTAIHLEKPDRVPATIHQWQPFHLKYFMNNVTDIEAFKEVGLDASINVYRTNDRESENWRISAREFLDGANKITDYTIDTPEGQLTYRKGSNEITTWTLDHLIKNEDDIYLLKKYRPVPLLDKKHVIETYDRLGDGGILRSFVTGNQGGCWQDACELFGVENLIMATYDNPDWVHEFMNILLDFKLKYIEESLSGAKLDLIETGGGASSCTVISPSIHEEFCLPYDRKMHNALRSLGHKTTYHTCGGMTKILDLILANGCDASETLSPPGVGGDIRDPSIVFEKFTGKIAMIGGLDQFNILTDGTPEMIRDEVKRLFHGFGINGGYIMSASDHFFHTKKENLIAFAEAAKECIY